MKVVVSNLIYVNVDSKWNYVCLTLDLYNRLQDMLAGKNKNAKSVEKSPIR